MSDENTLTKDRDLIDSQTEIRATDSLDCSGLLCPLPVYKTSIALGRLQEGDVLHLLTTDPGSLEDIPALARQKGDTVLHVEEGEGRQTFLIRKGASS